MQQAIVGFHLDEEGHYVADLACGHGQHVRHDPPWQNRPWVLTEQGRKEKLGVMLECKKCEEELLFLSRNVLPNNQIEMSYMDISKSSTGFRFRS
ncbi:hypothetical protein F953_01305 [Acinetobacter junii CIP 107470 = MTCC 11364]|uniref:DUF3565 domain-containing protein n=3 Tax=Moraxellaceae TaxID=468 RepID=A0AAW5RA46_ACIJU|nr:hypothetical protein F953_01305 [Acinetobacter junii CIP 107470 = MTCC 11364]MCU4397562.1 DUF3565 domain-containing protein [Acinetobacter junii]